MHRIIDIQVESLVKRLQGLEIALELTSDAKDFLVEVGSDVKNGARPLKRAIQRFVEDTLAEEILKGTIKKSSKVVVDFDAKAGELSFQSPSVKASKRSKEKQTA
jgi:ATP-dependent Clp protease ATP-binding subunit ClpC